MTVRQLDPIDAAATETRRRIGLVIMLASAAVFSTAGLFTKGVTADAWSVIFWRGLFAAIFTTSYARWRGTVAQEFREMGRPGLAVALLGASGTAAFIPAFKLTTIANVSLIYAAAPFLASAIAWLWFRDVVERRVLAAALVAALGVGLIVSGSLGQVNLGGDMLALWMTLMMSAVMVVYRRYPDTPAAGPNALSSVILLPVSLTFTDPFDAPAHEILVMAAFGLIFAFASVTLSEGARRLAPGEAALVSSLETPLAIIWAWMLFAEQPGPMAVTGGALILSAVFGSQIASLRRRPGSSGRNANSRSGAVAQADTMRRQEIENVGEP
ncbi:DMT family transporter [Sinirhodobacter populi]|uniref:DMT family transporter n=1 Tax=Paenirhodobacter populi TaxID=2306993 RepID=A0A443KEX2_9RHOB|nr:DMT family transporter [Sinirhodobacter populi]RWR31143.1 DMT family transporter [Sinirhodobacter populi]